MDRGEEEEGRPTMPPSRRELVGKFWARIPRKVILQNIDDNPMNMIKKAFQSLSEQEQTAIRQDQHGGEEPVEESASFIDEKLEELDREINLLSEFTRRAYHEAIHQEIEQEAAAAKASASANTLEPAADEGFISADHKANNDEGEQDDKAEKVVEFKNKPSNAGGKEEYVRSKSFRLLFLRAEQFNARLASRRITRYFKEKRELFGNEKLACKIKHVDLTELEKEFLLSGCICSTGATDTYGRLIVYYRPRLTNDFPVDCIMRSAFYFYQTIIENHVESQKKGLVVVGDARNLGMPQPASERRLYPFYRILIHALPFRNACWHPCFDNQVFHVFLNIALAVIPAKLRPRLQPHYGATAEEMFAALEEYGIRVEDLPLTSELGFEREPIETFLNTLRQKEEESL